MMYATRETIRPEYPIPTEFIRLHDNEEDGKCRTCNIRWMSSKIMWSVNHGAGGVYIPHNTFHPDPADIMDKASLLFCERMEQQKGTSCSMCMKTYPEYKK
jgi:hypothetical protein